VTPEASKSLQTRCPPNLNTVAEDLHFDNLRRPDLNTVQIYWSWLARNTRDLVVEGVQTFNNAPANSPQRRAAQTRLLVILGISLHAVQDFYTHSNWVEKHLRSANQPPSPGQNRPYRTETWWTEWAAQGNSRNPPQPNFYLTGWYDGHRALAEPNDWTAKHGNYTQGMNHDSYCRNNNWDEAYVFAYAATVEWVNAVMAWSKKEAARLGQSDPFAAAAISRYKITVPQQIELAGDLDAARQISEWILAPGHDGHWKGNNSSWKDNFVKALNKWATDPNSFIVNEYTQADGHGHRLIDRLARNLYGTGLASDGTAANNPMQIPLVAAGDKDLLQGDYAVLIRTTSVKYQWSPRGLDVFPYMYAKVKVDNQTYDDAAYHDTSWLSGPFSPKWWIIHFVDPRATSVQVSYELREQKDYGSLDEYYLFNVAGGVGVFTYDFSPTVNGGNGALQRNVIGNNPTAANPTAWTLGNNKPSVTFTVTHARLQ
jgi:hypothetical protein